MATLAAADKVMLTFVGTLCGQRVLNTFPLVVTAITGAPTVADSFDALLAKITAINELKAKFLACCPSNYTLIYIWIQKVYPVRIRKLIYSGAGIGTWDSAANTPNMAGVITRYGEIANRHGIGSLHVPISQGSDTVVDGYLTDDIKTPLSALSLKIEGFVSTAAPAVTYGHSLFPTPVSGLPVPVVDTAVQITARVMRRRTVGVGE